MQRYSLLEDLQCPLLARPPGSQLQCAFVRHSTATEADLAQIRAVVHTGGKCVSGTAFPHMIRAFPGALCRHAKLDCSINAATELVHGTFQVKTDSFILIFNNHGALFVSFREIFQQGPNNLNQNSRSVEGVRMASETSDDLLADDKTEMYGEHWSPDHTEVVHVSTQKFAPQACNSTLRGHCLSHDRHVLYVLYGSTVYGLNGVACTPLTRIEIPDGMSSINLMFLGRITVLQVSVPPDFPERLNFDELRSTER